MSELIVPGKWKCDQCGFVLNKCILAFKQGVVATDYRTVKEPCPNDGKLLRAYTWKEEAESGYESVERLFTELETERAAKEQAEAKLRVAEELLHQVMVEGVEHNTNKYAVVQMSHALRAEIRATLYAAKSGEAGHG